MDGRVDRADVFARRGLAHLAKHRLVHRLHVVNPFRKLLVGIGLERIGQFFLRRIGGVITVNPHPVHFAAAMHLILADDRNVVLALACQHASAATDARTQINRHTPLMQRGLFRLVERVRIKRLHDGRLVACKIFLGEMFVFFRIGFLKFVE